MLTDEDEHIDYEFAELDELAHAYAITIHRSQGSEYPVVVIPLTTSSWMVLQRNLLYTGITRAKQLIVLVGSRRALAQAIRTPRAGRRHTALTPRAQSIFWTFKDILTLERHGARTLHGLRARIASRLLTLAAAIALNHHLGRPSRQLARPDRLNPWNHSSSASSPEQRSGSVRINCSS